MMCETRCSVHKAVDHVVIVVPHNRGIDRRALNGIHRGRSGWVYVIPLHGNPDCRIHHTVIRPIASASAYAYLADRLPAIDSKSGNDRVVRPRPGHRGRTGTSPNPTLRPHDVAVGCAACTLLPISAESAPPIPRLTPIRGAADLPPIGMTVTNTGIEDHRITDKKSLGG